MASSPAPPFSARPRRLVVAPEVGFDVLCLRLAALGYRLDAANAAPLVPGEPEWARFERGPEAPVGYAYNPVASFRQLTFGGPSAAAAQHEAIAALPCVDSARARSFLRSPNPRDQWLGLLAAEALEDGRLLPFVEALANGADVRIAAAARRTHAALPRPDPAPLAAWEALRDEQQRRPGAAAWFRHLPEVEWKRQLLRRSAHELPAATPAFERMLRTALGDDDVETRVTAMLVAARLRCFALAGAVRDAVVPTDRGAGAPSGDRFYLRRLQRLAFGYLTAPDGAVLDAQSARRRLALERALRGAQPVDSDETLLWHALTTPLDLAPMAAAPARSAGFRSHDDALQVGDHRIALCRVGAVPHWLGGHGTPVRSDNPERAIHLSVHPLTCSVVALVRPDLADSGDAPWTGSWPEAQAVVQAVAAAAGVAGGPPERDEWERAARGPDGRFHPWGMGVQPGWRAAVSPWGLGGWGLGDEWAFDAAAGAPVVVGGLDPRPTAIARPPSGPALVRMTLRP